MELKLFCFLVVLTIVKSDVVDYEKYESFPSPQKNFQVDRYVGNWYIQARLPSCSWVGSFDFNNYVSQYSLNQDGTVDLKDTYRTGDDCASVGMFLTPRDIPGVFDLKDGFGNAVSGPSYIVATDYKKFVVKWGCNKVLGSKCTDPYVVVKTRKRNPSAHTWKIVEKILHKFFGLKLTSMVRVIHDERACIKFPEKHDYHHDYHLPTYHHLKKTYRK